jgi:hypothetical protein
MWWGHSFCVRCGGQSFVKHEHVQGATLSTSTPTWNTCPCMCMCLSPRYIACCHNTNMLLLAELLSVWRSIIVY